MIGEISGRVILHVLLAGRAGTARHGRDRRRDAGGHQV